MIVLVLNVVYIDIMSDRLMIFFVSPNTKNILKYTSFNANDSVPVFACVGKRHVIFVFYFWY